MKLTICQNDACDNGKLVSLIVSEPLEEQQDLDIKEKKLNTRGFINVFSRRATGLHRQGKPFKLNFFI